MTMEDLAKRMLAMQGQLKSLSDRNEVLEQQAVAVKTTGHFKVKEPETYDGTKGGLRAFLTNMRAYLEYYRHTITSEEDKVGCTATFLTGDAKNWFEPYLRDFLSNPVKEREDETNEIFTSYATFEEKISGTFGNPDEKRTASQELSRLKQRGSASEYAARFQQIASKLGWDDEPKITMFYNGLKDNVKDEIYKQDQPDEFSEYIVLAIKIDNRL